MTKNQKIQCNAIIHAASIAAASVGAGLAQVPGSDNTIIVPIQLAMTVSLGKVFGLKLSKAAAISAMGTSTTTILGRATSQVLIGWIPVAGNIINASTAASITEALGWILAKEFEKDYSELIPTESEKTDEMHNAEAKILKIIRDDDNDSKAEDIGIKTSKKIRKQFKVLREDRAVS